MAGMATVCSLFRSPCVRWTAGTGLRLQHIVRHTTNPAVPADDASASRGQREEDETVARVVLNGSDCFTPSEAKTNLLGFLNQSDIQKRKGKVSIPHFTAGSYLSVTRADPHSPSGTSEFVGICIALRNKGLGSNFILRNVIDGVGVEMMFELYSPTIQEIKVLKLERRRRAKLYYLRDKPAKYSTVSEKMEAVDSGGKVLRYKRRGGPA